MVIESNVDRRENIQCHLVSLPYGNAERFFKIALLLG